MHIHKPEGEKWLGKYEHNTFETYQLSEYKLAMKMVKNKRVAIDIGANLGIMSYRMVKDFEYVHAFEPLFYDYLSKNVNSNNFKVYPYAVGDEEKIETMRIGIHRSGGSNIVKTKEEDQTYKDVKVVKIDSFNIKNVDFIKIDVENYELYVLLGSLNTIEEYKPTILIELQETNPNYDKILDLFKSLNYKREIVGDLDSVFYQ
jgi:FkbM family methyltransferase